MNYFDNKKSMRTLCVVGFTDEYRRMLTEFLSMDFTPADDDAYLIICEEGKAPKNHPAEKTIIIGDAKKQTRTRSVYFPRPVDLAALRSVALSIAESDSVSAASGEYVADPVNRTVSFGGKTARLTTHEFRLFMLLNSRIGEVVSRNDIRRTLMGNDSESNMPDVYVCYLRKKLEEISGKGALISVRGSGYMLAIPKL